MAKALDIIRQCGALAADALTLGAMSEAAERERLVLQVQTSFPGEWERVLETVDRLDRVSAGKASPYVLQMWAMGPCSFEEVRALNHVCPEAFRDIPFCDVVGTPASEMLPKLAKSVA